ncbi:hypothetical protein EPD60_07400 [Flaviaesturariibacter flavus]|uniref:DUF4350 domain-containing protein n=1 Tax=Flaviaesturariibacter flavus TaxID=2502780 RepID=A0A4V2NW99_9BACT|nr:DUF4350 domain-containing protein [Flaviaesturariibacter flavus]TCJ16562.1 hypothetical protein EPD60_07400 [Flaviaesturariibacter flavus]
MKRNGLLIGGALLLVVIAVLVIGGGRRKEFNQRITLRYEDRIPYGYSIARGLVPDLFPGVPLVNDRNAPGAWDSIDVNTGGQAVVLVGRELAATDDELETLLAFVEKGNYVFCIAPDFSSAVFDRLRLYNSTFYSLKGEDTLRVQLRAPRFNEKRYTFPGPSAGIHFSLRGADSTVVLGTDGDDHPNFLQYRVGKGALFLHGEPMAFTNYFLLQPGNETYYAQAFSVLPQGLRRLVWNEYYLTAHSGAGGEPNWLGVLMKQQPFAWAFWVLLFILGLYLLSEMRRRQRPIPPHPAPRNESLDFVKTVGRLYYDKRDDHNLALKMIQYFLEGVRHHYKINTTVLDSEFVQRLEARSGYPRERLQSLMDLVARLRHEGRTTPAELQDLHRQLEAYYQTI